MSMKPIYTPTGRALEYGDHSLNIYTGCNHGCIYCYAKKMHDHYKPNENYADVKLRAGLLEALDKQLESGAFKNKLIHLCFTCDPYPADIDTTPTRAVIRMLKAADAHVQILTKGGHRAERDFDLLDGNDWFGVTITSTSSFMDFVGDDYKREPNAAPTIERAMSLYVAHDAGIKTWVSFEPVYDPKVVYASIKSWKHIDLFRIGKLNHYASDIDWKAFGNECVRLCELYGRNYYIKQDLRDAMEG